jgi:hypothetical protein
MLHRPFLRAIQKGTCFDRYGLCYLTPPHNYGPLSMLNPEGFGSQLVQNMHAPLLLLFILAPPCLDFLCLCYLR